MTLRTNLLALASGLALALSIGVGLVGCDTIDQKFDCQQICSRYKDCFDSGYNTDTCRSRCEDKAANEQAFADKANACENCLDDKSCTGSFACASECIGIVP